MLAITTNLVVVTNMAIMGVFLKKNKNADQTRELFVNRINGLKVTAETKNYLIFWPFTLYFGPIAQLA